MVIIGLPGITLILGYLLAWYLRKSPGHQTRKGLPPPCSDYIGLMACLLSGLIQPSKQVGSTQSNRKSPQSLPQFVDTNCTLLAVRDPVWGWDATLASDSIVMGNGARWTTGGPS